MGKIPYFFLPTEQRCFLASPQITVEKTNKINNAPLFYWAVRLVRADKSSLFDITLIFLTIDWVIAVYFQIAEGEESEWNEQAPTCAT